MKKRLNNSNKYEFLDHGYENGIIFGLAIIFIARLFPEPEIVKAIAFIAIFIIYVIINLVVLIGFFRR